ncbi:type IV pilus modification protein PilV [Collimonas fungivorans]|uniref:Type 4 fimbrial biogenesis protein PilV n=1 Tax=Collimonas fungivorans (strain Ter331) TaxID=1005048 RepID=G0ADG8_COLFT|nr:type IV pilus modification protein PilV [Collimonas fungivorans]AEK63430.1 type 4 fimbrial biogenesis protein PilV [Collimonas fungivorans Ter331]
MAFLNKKISHRSGRQRGVGMIEVLIAITISAFALLGLAGLQVAALRYQKVANFRSLASQYSADIGDRIRANAAGANAGGYTTDKTYPDNSNAAACAVSGACTPAEIAVQDIYNWRLAMSNAMAGGWGTVSGDSTNGFVVTVYFSEPDKTATDSGCDSSVFPSGFSANDKAAMRCFLTVVTP